MKSDRKKDPIPLRKEEGEPVVNRNSVPVGFVVGLVFMVFVGMTFLERHAGGFSAKVYPPYASTKELERLAPPTDDGGRGKGKEVYERTCLLCHQPSGLGQPPNFPPLVGSEWVLTESPNRMIRIVLNGLQGPIQIKGEQWDKVMVSWRDLLKDDEIAAVISYVRNEWGNKASIVTAEQVKAVRDETKDRPDAWTAAELLKVPEK